MNKSLYEEFILNEESLKKDSEYILNEKISLSTKLFLIISIIDFLMFTYGLIKITATSIREMEKQSTYSDYYTKLIQRITKDKTIKIRIMSNNYLNAFCLFSDIYITEGLLMILNENEIISVLLHEYGHSKEKDTNRKIRNYYIGNLISIALFRTSISFLIPSYNILFHLIYSIFSSFISFKIGDKLSELNSKKREYIADSYAREFGYGKYLAKVLQKLEDEDYKLYKVKFCSIRLSEESCREKFKQVLEKMNREHPETKDRIEKILKDKLSKLVFNGEQYINGSLNYLSSLKSHLISKEQQTDDTNT